MKISVVVPVFDSGKDILKFLQSIEEKILSYTDDYSIVVTTNLGFDYIQEMHEYLPKNIDLVALKTTDDYQQVVMAGIDKADGDANIILSPEYDVMLIDEMMADWNNGSKIVCLRRKHGKIGKFFSKLRLKIYNLFLFLFGDIFSLGIFKDAQLLSKEVVEKMKSEQEMAHRFRTMFAPLDYDTSVIDIEHPIEKFETRGTPQFDFWLGIIGSIITFFAFITCIALAVSLGAKIWMWTVFFIFWLIFQFIFAALLVNATARVKIGILHNVDSQGKIYNMVQEYPAEVIEKQGMEVASKKSSSIKNTKNSKSTTKLANSNKENKIENKGTKTSKKSQSTKSNANKNLKIENKSNTIKSDTPKLNNVAKKTSTTKKVNTITVSKTKSTNSSSKSKTNNDVKLATVKEKVENSTTKRKSTSTNNK